MEASMSSESAVAEFKAKLRGELIGPGDESYEKARQVYNAMIDRRPRWIVRCDDVADVIASVNFARENEIRLAIRRRTQRGWTWRLRRRSGRGSVVDLLYTRRS